MSRKLKHLTYAHLIVPANTHSTWCDKYVPASDSVERSGKDDDDYLKRVTCKRCLKEKANLDRWSEHFQADLREREERGEPEARYRAWNATFAALGPNPRSYPGPKRSVTINTWRGEDGRGRFEVAAPKGARFASGPHARSFESREEAERVRGEVEIERCPPDCGCGLGKTVEQEKNERMAEVLRAKAGAKR